MYFKTAIIRGTDISNSFSFDYRTGRKNLNNITSEALVVPGGYGNKIWVVGDGGPNGGIVAEWSNADDIFENGLYMVRKDIQGNKLGTAGKGDGVKGIAKLELNVAVNNDADIYTVDVSPASNDYYGIDYHLGDLVELNSDRGYGMQINNQKNRIYQVELSYSDNNVETVSLQLSADYKSKFPNSGSAGNSGGGSPGIPGGNPGGSPGGSPVIPPGSVIISGIPEEGQTLTANVY